jgi:hypothetical protein
MRTGYEGQIHRCRILTAAVLLCLGAAGHLNGVSQVLGVCVPPPGDTHILHVIAEGPGAVQTEPRPVRVQFLCGMYSGVLVRS